MPQNLQILLKKAGPEDWKAMLSLYSSLDEYDLKCRLFGPHHVFADEPKSMANQDDRYTLLAFAGATPVGEASLQTDGEVSVVVAKDWKHQGIAPLLFRELIEIARNRGFERVWFAAPRDNSGMIQLGRDFAFRVISHSSEEEKWVLDFS